ncbi:MAG: hypothetical protein GX072_10030 [Lysinibacillus sp.]|nr:hypothetical protein [Lysinibacillus sp.]
MNKNQKVIHIHQPHQYFNMYIGNNQNVDRLNFEHKERVASENKIIPIEKFLNK